MKYCRLAIMGVMAAALFTGEAWCASQGNIIASYTLADSDGAVRMLSKVDVGQSLRSGDYAVKANLQLKSEKRETYSPSLDLKWPEVSASNSRQSEGWMVKDGTYSWLGTKSAQPIDVPLTIKPNAGVPSALFDELRVDYLDTFENPSLLLLKMVVSGQKAEEKIVVSGEAEKPLRPVDTLKMTSEIFERKNVKYSVKRELGLPLDPNWRYTQDGHNTVLQRRFHRDFTSIEAIDMVLRPGIDARKVGVNLRLGYRDYPKPAETVEGFALPQKIIKAEGRRVLRVEFGMLMRQPSYSGKKKVFLEEILIHLPGQMEQVVHGEILEEIVFLTAVDIDKSEAANEGEKSDLALKLPTRTEVLSQEGRKRFRVDLRQLTGQDLNSKIQSITLTVRPQKTGSPGGFRLLRAGMFTSVNNERPVFLEDGERLNKRWGGPFLLPDDEKVVEWPHVVSYLPFQDLRRERKWVADTDHPLPPGAKIFDLVQMGGATIQSPNPITVIRSENGLLIDGRGKWVDVYWPVGVPMSKDTRFFLGIASEIEARVEISPVVKGRHLKTLSVLPNQSIVLNIPETHIDGLNARIIFPGDEPFRFLLKEMVLFRAVAITPTQAINFSLPVWGETPLTPVEIQSLPGSRVLVDRAHLTIPEGNVSGPLVWTTEVGRKMNWVQALRVKYRIPSIANEPSCWLRLTLVGSTHQVERTICPGQSAGEILIPAEDIFRDTGWSSAEELKSIIWKVNVGSQGMAGQVPLPLDLNMTLDGVGMYSLRDRLTWHPLLDWKGRMYFPALSKVISEEDLLAGNAWVDLDRLIVEDAADGAKIISSFNFQEYPHFHAKTVVLERSLPVAQKIWMLLAKERFQALTTHKVKKDFRLAAIASPLLVFLLGIFWCRVRQSATLLVWVVVAASLYGVGVVMMYTQAGSGTESYFFSVGAMAMVFIWRTSSQFVQRRLENYWPTLAGKADKRRGAYYITGFLILLIAEVLLFMINLQPVAEQFAIIGYYMLILGVTLEARVLRKRGGAGED